MENLTKYNSLIGKTISVDGWNYDNGGTMNGVITEIYYNEMYKEWYVKVDKDSEYSLDKYSFRFDEMDLLLLNNELPKANPLLNCGKNAFIK